MRVLLAAILSVGIAVPASATIFQNGAVNTSMFVGSGSFGATPMDTDSTIVPAAITALSGATGFSPGFFVSTFHSANANWASADAGTILMDWNMQLSSTSGYTYAGSAGWEYSFTATGDGAFTARYAITGSGQPNMTYLALRDDMFHVVDTFDGTGQFSVGLTNGQSYTVRLSHSSDQPGSQYFIGTEQALIDWDITYQDVVPEPASWAMLITGFGLVGAAMRRRVLVRRRG